MNVGTRSNRSAVAPRPGDARRPNAIDTPKATRARKPGGARQTTSRPVRSARGAWGRDAMSLPPLSLRYRPICTANEAKNGVRPDHRVLTRTTVEAHDVAVGTAEAVFALRPVQLLQSATQH